MVCFLADGNSNKGYSFKIMPIFDEKVILKFATQHTFD